VVLTIAVTKEHHDYEVVIESGKKMASETLDGEKDENRKNCNSSCYNVGSVGMFKCSVREVLLRLCQ